MIRLHVRLVLGPCITKEEMPLTEEQIELLLPKCKNCHKLLEGLRRDFCSNSCKSQFYQIDSYNAQQARGLVRKLQLVEFKGGCCQVCGYKKNLAALEFHHLNEEDKLFALDLRSISNRSIERLIEEVNKCELVCANCHREGHNPQMDMQGLMDKPS